VPLGYGEASDEVTERGQRRGPLRSRLLLATAALALSGCTMRPASDHAKQIQGVYYLTFVFAAVIFVVVGGAIVYAAVRFRHKPGDDTLPKQVHGSTKVEIVWTVIPTIIVAVLFVASAVTLGKVDSAEANPLQVNVTGFQWQWEFTYPAYHDKFGHPLSIKGQTGLPGEGLAKPTLGLPVGQAVHFTEASPDAIHSFYIPVFLFKRDVIPGHVNNFFLTPTRTGTFAGKCAELCGLYHSEMLFIVKIMPKDQFDQWIKDQITIQNRHASACTQPQDGKVTIVAKSIQFDLTCIQVPPSPATTIVFDNQDAGIQHNVDIYQDPNFTQHVAGATGATDTITGVTSTSYSISGLQPGTYYFKCDIHPQMKGTYVVKG
jgi:cytochrome c oxidase subunit 2